MQVIEGATVFDGEEVVGRPDVLVADGRVVQLGGAVPTGAEVVDGRGGTLLPGLVDAHVHTSRESLALALRFGVTTELEMQGQFTRGNRSDVEQDDTVADVRSAGFAITPPGGHPSELFPPDFRPGPPENVAGDGPEPGTATGQRPFMPFCTTPEEAVAAVRTLAETGSDYIKFMVDDGRIEGAAVPQLDQPTLDAGVAAARELGLLTVAHALTFDATLMCVRAGVHGLAHLFMDRPHTDDVIARIADAGMFVVPCVVLDASMMGVSGADLADDPRVGRRLDPAWAQTLRASFGHFPQGNLDDVLASVLALYAAGVPLLVGTDASVPLPFLGGLAHGASVHRELQYLVRAGLTPADALRAATSTPADVFGLTDRGRIAVGARADLLLVDGDPTVDVTHTLDTRAVWRRGARSTQV